MTSNVSSTGGDSHSKNPEPKLPPNPIPTSMVDLVSNDEDFDVDEGPVRKDISTYEVDISDYDTTPCSTELKYLKEMSVNLRGVSEAWVDMLDQRFRKNFIPDMAKVIVINLDKGGTSAVTEDVFEDGNVEKRARPVIRTEVVIVDGRHRSRLYRHYEQLEGDDWASNLIKNIPAVFYSRKDGRPIGNQEAIALAALFNQTSETSLNMKFHDKVHACISFLRTAFVMKGTERVPLDLETVNTPSAVVVLSKIVFMTELGDRQRSRYAQVALMVAKSAVIRDKFFDVVNEDSFLTLTHISSPVLLRASDETIVCLALDCVALKATPRAGRVEGSFEAIRTQYFEAIENIYGAMVAVCKEKGVLVVDLLKQTFKLGPNTISIREHIATQMQDFQGSRNKAKQIGSKKGTIMKRVYPAVDNMTPSTDITSIQVQPKIDTEARGADGKKDVSSANGGQLDNDDVHPVDEGSLEDRERPRRSTRNKDKKTGSPDEPTDEKEDDEMGQWKRIKPQKRRSTGKGNKKIKTVSTSAAKLKSMRKSMESVSRAELAQLLQDIGLGVTVPLEKGWKQPAEIARYEDGEGCDFDDYVPGDPPYGVEELIGENVPPMFGELAVRLDKDWSAITKPRMHPCLASRKGNKHGRLVFLELESKHLYLFQCGIPMQHRAHILLTKETVLQNHQQTWYNIECDASYGMSIEELETLASLHNHPSGMGENFYRTACITSGLIDCKAYFVQKKYELDHDGYTSFHGLFKEFGGEKHWVLKNLDRFDWFDDLMKHFQHGFQTFENEANKDFHHIINVGTDQDEKQSRKGIGRYQSSRECVMEHMETKEKVKFARMRAVADVRMGTAINMLQLSNQVSKHEAMFCPDTGSRVLVSTKGVGRQKIHSDRRAMGKQDTIIEKRNPGYFTVVTGDQHAYIWAVPGSHRSIATTKAKDILSLNAVSTAEKVHIPPYSLFVGRGDLQHAGAGSSDYPKFGEPQLRMHSMFFPIGENFPNAIQIVTNYDPKFSGEYSSDSSSDDSREASETTSSSDGESTPETPQQVSEESPRERSSDEEYSDEESDLDSGKGNENDDEEESGKSGQDEEDDEMEADEKGEGDDEEVDETVVKRGRRSGGKRKKSSTSGNPKQTKHRRK